MDQKLSYGKVTTTVRIMIKEESEIKIPNMVVV